LGQLANDFTDFLLKIRLLVRAFFGLDLGIVERAKIAPIKDATVKFVSGEVHDAVRVPFYQQEGATACGFGLIALRYPRFPLVQAGVTDDFNDTAGVFAAAADYETEGAGL